MATMEMVGPRPANAAALDPDNVYVARARTGDRDAFEELFRRHYRQVYGVVSRVLADPDEAEDAVQDAFVRAFRGLSGFRGEAAFSTWLCRIAINVALRRAQRARVQPSPFSDVPEDCPEIDPADPLDVQAEVERHTQADEVRRAVETLPAKHRAVVSLRYFDDRSCEEIAGLLGCSVGTVWSRLYHAHRKLRGRLSWLGGGGE